MTNLIQSMVQQPLGVLIKIQFNSRLLLQVSLNIMKLLNSKSHYAATTVIYFTFD